MPQSERAEILKKLMKWLATQERGATVQTMLAYVKWEITEGGATDNAVKKYIEDLDKQHLIEYRHPFWTIRKTVTQSGPIGTTLTLRPADSFVPRCHSRLFSVALGALY